MSGRRRLAAVVVLVAVPGVLLACSPRPGVAEQSGEFADGGAAFSVTYRPSPGEDLVEVEVVGGDCQVIGGSYRFGQDVSTEAQIAHQSAARDDPSAPMGSYAGVVSGSYGGPEHSYRELSIVLPDGHVYVSREPFDLRDGALEVVDHRGRVGRGGVWATEEVVDGSATAAGWFRCGSTTTVWGR